MTSAQPANTVSAPKQTYTAPTAIEDGDMVFLSVKVNGNPDDNLVAFIERSGRLYLSHESALQLNFDTEFLQSLPPNMPLSDYPGVVYTYDRQRQAIDILASFSILTLETTIVGGPGNARTIASASPGLLLNYDLYSSYTNKDNIDLSGFAELRGFNDVGLISSTHLLQGVRSGNPHRWEHTTVRMNTVLEHSLQDSQITFRLGDTITNSVSWSRRTRIGGFQVSRNFDLQPYQTTVPLPAYFGTAALPSAVELYVNGIQQYTGRVPSGPFELNAMPMVNGAGRAQVVLTDALGRSTSVDFPFYTSSRLLRKGLTDWSFEAGYVRANYGYRSFDYGDPMASAVIRHGLTNDLTLESHMEGSKEVMLAGLGAILNVGGIGTFSGSWAQSLADGKRGTQYTAGYELRRGLFNIGVNLQRSDGAYRDVASAYGGAPVLRSDSAYVGVDTGKFGTFSLNHAYLQQADQPRYRFAGASWSRNLGKSITLSVSANQNLDDRADRSFYLNLIFSLGDGLSSYSSATQSKGARSYSAGIHHSARTDDEWSWSVQGQYSQAHTVNASAQASKRLRHMDVNLGVNTAKADQNAYAGASGAIVLMDGNIFASRRINDGFAVVSTSGVPSVPVKSENKLVGETSRHGQLLVPSLQAYQHNKISIDPIGLPVDMRIKRVTMDAVPRHGSGVNVKFAIDRVRAASIILHATNGDVVPMGARAYLNGGAQPAGWVGYDGRLYLEDLEPENQLVIQNDDNAICSVRFPYTAELGTLPEIGPFVCAPQ